MKRVVQLTAWLVSILIVFSASLPVVGQDVPACEAGALLTPGVTSETLTVDGQTRDYLLYVPASLDLAQPIPVVFSLHGFASNARQQMGLSLWNDVADEGGFLVVYPQGLGVPPRWNAGPVGDRNPGNTDDVGFLTALADDLVATRCADPSRLFVNGMSNGGGMTYRTACEAADVFAAFGGVAGAYSERLSCDPSRTAPFLFFHGTSDPIVPFEGGPGLPNIPAFVAAYAESAGCAAEPVPLPGEGSVSGMVYPDCDEGAEVGLTVIDGGGHTWPGGTPLPGWLVGETTQDISASEALWTFYQAHPLE